MVGVGVGMYIVDRMMIRRKQNPKYEIPAEIRQSPLACEAQVAVTLALKAGRNMVSYCDEKGTEAELNHNLGISEKGQPEDFCTVIDVENERLVMHGLLEAFPTHKLIGEETTGTEDIPPLSKEHPTWIIDPIDGTTNFVSGLPLTCVSIGLCVEGKPVLGVVYAPMTDELYIAVSGHGAYRNGVRLRKQQPVKRMVDAVVGFEFGYARGKEKSDKMLAALGRIMENGCRTTRSLGSGVLDLVYVATGRLDVIYSGITTEGWKPWDYCAGVIIARETGCVVEAIDQTSGADFDLYSKSIICAGSEALLQETRALIS
ncbi:myo-inositol-1(or 4)-monophosphatase [Fistulifera solaris]|uniref:Inositol-1-monophosphatase n=1 Tax=Fistulifera solaris TaxID=1519565 RepID=A0A1Z5JQD3_FISSO|nr:myo-inositol-1(or 4)-monophosphatase [Fistulifera solaris]|eukprot:GAX16169.1 myo-inositol-1(or 4)-monophosphatase [Fistulifera solaris]